MSTQWSDDELKHLRELLVADKRRAWAISTIKSMAIYITAVSGGYLAFKGVIAELLK